MSESEPAPYRGHVDKMQQLERKRIEPFDSKVLQRMSEESDASQIFELLGGSMILPEDLEAELWLTVVGFVMNQGGTGVRVDGTEWSVLDMLLVVASRTDDFPVLLLVEMMLGFNELVVELRGRPIHAGQLYNVTYDGWSKMDDLKERGRHHFKFGFLLLTIGEIPRAAEQLKLALLCDKNSGARDLLMKLFSEKGDPLTLPDGSQLSKADVLAFNDSPNAQTEVQPVTEKPSAKPADAVPSSPPKKVMPSAVEETDAKTARTAVVAIGLGILVVGAALFWKSHQRN